MNANECVRGVGKSPLFVGYFKYSYDQSTHLL